MEPNALASANSLSPMLAGDHSQRGCCTPSARAARCRSAAPMRPARQRAAQRDCGVLPRPDPGVCASGHTAACAACLASLREQQRRALRRRRSAPDICHSHARLPAGTGAEAHSLLSDRTQRRNECHVLLQSAAACPQTHCFAASLFCAGQALCLSAVPGAAGLPVQPGIIACAYLPQCTPIVVSVLVTSVARPVTLTGRFWDVDRAAPGHNPAGQQSSRHDSKIWQPVY